MEIVERPNGFGQPRVRIISGTRREPRWDPWQRRYVQQELSNEILCLTPEIAEELAPRLMEWLIKRKRSNE